MTQKLLDLVMVCWFCYLAKWIKFGFPAILWRTHERNGQKFGMLLHPNYSQKSFVFGHGLFIFLLLSQFWLSKMGQIWGFQAFYGDHKQNPFVSCNINNIKEINDIVKASYVKIMPLTRSLECESHTGYSGGNNSCSLSDVAECSIILNKNTPPSEFLPDSNTVYPSGDTRIFSQSHPPPLINEYKHPFGLKNPKFQCFFKFCPSVNLFNFSE